MERKRHDRRRYHRARLRGRARHTRVHRGCSGGRIDGGDDLNKLVGRGGEVLDALQELTRLAVHQKTGVRSRLMLDIASWRRRRREELAALGDKIARRVLSTGEREELSPMTPFERKIVHDAVAAVPGVHSESEGAEPARRVVVLVD